MGKFGKSNKVSLNPLDYNICLMGESKIGKSTLAKEVCEKLVGTDGYIGLDIGREDGHGAIEGIVTEPCPDWAKFSMVVDDIVENKASDYKDLKVVIIDTYDELCNIAEKEVIRMWNNKNSDKKVDTINSCYGGFGRGLDKVIEIMLDKLWELKKVDVHPFIIIHTKQKDVEDVMAEEKYSILTSNVSQKYFNAIKTKLHFCGVAYIDRNIVQQKTNKKDSTGKVIMKGKVAGESRIINFRDDTYSVDSGSRFADIIPQIPFDPDNFIEALKNAILAEQAKGEETLEDAEKRQKKEDADKTKAVEKYSENKKNAHVDEEKNEELVAIIGEKFYDAADEVKDEIKKLMKDNKVKDFKDPDIIPTKVLEKIVKLLK